jgi:uncharacterized membrane protein (DUF106 family)
MTDIKHQQHTPWLLWPFVAVWRLVTFILSITGRFIAVVLGFVLGVVGFLLTVTIIGAIVGVPMMVLGLLLVLRGLF